ncbi:MAG: NADH-quinone oxidoreductase subunit N [Candidatus Micrarchaeota archaeon]|nr:NADH-quinone oxidoreductase subunit N [Candidatus Micrarchaeota archaeon]
MDTPQYLIFAMFFCIGGLITVGIAAILSKKRVAAFMASSALLSAVVVSAAYLLAANYDATLFNLVHVYVLSSLFIMIFSISIMLVNMLAYSNSRDYHEVSFLLGISFAGMFMVATAVSILAILIGLELLAIATAFMILLEGRHRIEAAVKFFILGSVSVAVLAFALALLLPYDPALALSAAPAKSIVGTGMIILSIVMFAAAFGFDAALFPFNLWVPDVYEGSPGYVTSMLAGINKKVAFLALIEVFFLVFLAYRSTFSTIFTVLAILTMFFGNLVALAQKSVKRLLAYSSISQAGYILVGLATVTQYGLEASIFYIIAHAFMIIGAFAIVMWLESNNIKTIDDYTALDSRNRFAAIALTIFMLSMAGIPPLIGFAGKFLLFSSAISGNLAILAAIGIINSFISIYYYARVMNAMYSRKAEKALGMELYVAAVVVIALGIVIAFGAYPQPLIAIASRAASSLIGI